MELIRIQRILNKTDLGISGKNGTEILLDSNTKEYFDDIHKYFSDNEKINLNKIPHIQNISKEIDLFHEVIQKFLIKDYD